MGMGCSAAGDPIGVRLVSFTLCGVRRLTKQGGGGLQRGIRLANHICGFH